MLSPRIGLRVNSCAKAMFVSFLTFSNFLSQSSLSLDHRFTLFLLLDYSLAPSFQALSPSRVSAIPLCTESAASACAIVWIHLISNEQINDISYIIYMFTYLFYTVGCFRHSVLCMMQKCWKYSKPVARFFFHLTVNV